MRSTLKSPKSPTPHGCSRFWTSASSRQPASCSWSMPATAAGDRRDRRDRRGPASHLRYHLGATRRQNGAPEEPSPPKARLPFSPGSHVGSAAGAATTNHPAPRLWPMATNASPNALKATTLLWQQEMCESRGFKRRGAQWFACKRTRCGEIVHSRFEI